MVRTAFTAAFAAVWAAITAIQLYYFLNLQPGAACAGTTTTSAASTGDFQIFLTLVAAGAFHAAVVLIYRHLHQAEAAAAGNRRVPDRVAFLLLAAAGLLVLQGVPGAVDDVVGALGAASFRALPAAATATFFLGTMTLIFAAHVRAGGAVAGDGQIFHGAVPLLTKAAFTAAAGLVCMIAIVAVRQVSSSGS